MTWNANDADDSKMLNAGEAEEQEITAKFDRSELNLYTIPELKIIPKTTFGAKTDLGKVREHNEDRWDFYEPENKEQLSARGKLYLVCDGMGGHSAGQIASELTCKTFIKHYYGLIASPPEEAGKTAANAANRYVYDVASMLRQTQGMGTTLTALALCQDNAYITQIGDSRCYRYRAGELRQITVDHSWVAEQSARGVPEEELMDSPYAHVITRACGYSPQVVPDVFIEPLEVGDIFLLCSDGLTNFVSDDAIKTVLKSEPPSPACISLVQQAMDGGGGDNCTVVIVRVDELTAVSKLNLYKIAK